MKNRLFALGMLVMALVFGMVVVGCDNGTTGGGGDNGLIYVDDIDEPLPAASGNNALIGKTYYIGEYEKITFSTTAAGDTQGTYARGYPDKGTYTSGQKFTYRDIETGTYSWNEEAKTVTLKPGKMASMSTESHPDYSPPGATSVTINADYGQLGDRAACRLEVQAFINEVIQEMGQAYVNQALSEMGFSSVASYINYQVNEVFANKTNGYSFSTDGTALFLEKALPANKGTNEFLDQTYYGIMRIFEPPNPPFSVKDTQQVYVFTASDYTFTKSQGGSTLQTITGSYAYDSSRKQVWLRPSTIDGKDREAYYTQQTAQSGHHLADDNAYRAAQTNAAFNNWYEEDYNSTEKTIGREYYY
jgi:hypothetical protein